KRHLCHAGTCSQHPANRLLRRSIQPASLRHDVVPEPAQPGRQGHFAVGLDLSYQLIEQDRLPQQPQGRGYLTDLPSWLVDETESAVVAQVFLSELAYGLAELALALPLDIAEDTQASAPLDLSLELCSDGGDALLLLEHFARQAESIQQVLAHLPAEVIV